MYREELSAETRMEIETLCETLDKTSKNFVKFMCNMPSSLLKIPEVQREWEEEALLERGMVKEVSYSPMVIDIIESIGSLDDRVLVGSGAVSYDGISVDGVHIEFNCE